MARPRERTRPRGRAASRRSFEWRGLGNEPALGEGLRGWGPGPTLLSEDAEVAQLQFLILDYLDDQVTLHEILLVGDMLGELGPKIDDQLRGVERQVLKILRAEVDGVPVPRPQFITPGENVVVHLLDEFARQFGRFYIQPFGACISRRPGLSDESHSEFLLEGPRTLGRGE